MIWGLWFSIFEAGSHVQGAHPEPLAKNPQPNKPFKSLAIAGERKAPQAESPFRSSDDNVADETW